MSPHTSPFNDGVDSLANQDYYTDPDVERPYMKYVGPAIVDCLDILNANAGVKTYINSYWFQQYNEGDMHNFHTHPACNYSSVYYVECPKGMATNFIIRDDIVEIDAEEGDYIIFPSTKKHRSKKNFSGERKTVIALNLNFV